MHLYLIQHGEAAATPQHPERTLTESGKAGIIKTATFFKRLRPAPPQIWHSGKLRARQTADLLRQIACPDSQMITRADLNPLDPVDDLAIEMDALDIKELVIVGHLPHLAKLASKLLTGDPDSLPIQFHNAGIVCIMGNLGKWETQWIVTPAILG